MDTPIQTAIKLVEKCMAPKHETEANVAYGAVIRILKDLLPEEAAFLKGATERRIGAKKEIEASMYFLPPTDGYKKGFNDAMLKTIEIIESYEKGEGVFQR